MTTSEQLAAGGASLRRAPGFPGVSADHVTATAHPTAVDAAAVAGITTGVCAPCYDGTASAAAGRNPFWYVTADPVARRLDTAFATSRPDRVVAGPFEFMTSAVLAMLEIAGLAGVGI